MTKITSIYILYNPVSTGSSYSTAKEMYENIKKIGLSVELIKTKYKGHAGEFAETHATEASTLLISSSGDGTYHEIVNAVLSNSKPSARAITGLLPSGNANDHYHFVHEGNTVERIRLGDVRAIDSLEVTFGAKRHFAHSYAGVGITSQIGDELNKTDLNRFNEAWLVVKNLFKVRSVKLIVEGKKRRFDSLVFSTNGRMSKVLTLSKEAQIDDGLFEVNALHSTRLPRLFHFLVKASTIGVATAPQTDKFSFTTTHKTSMQLDGEIVYIPAHTTVTIRSNQQSLRCIV